MRSSLSIAGIQKSQDGSHEVPASRRSDGSARKPIKVRPGYVPVEDTAKYRPPRSRDNTGLAKITHEDEKSRLLKDGKSVAAARPKAESRAGHSPIEEKVLSPVNQVKSAWTDSGWRNAKGSTSIYARSEVSLEAKPRVQKSIAGSRAGPPLHAKNQATSADTTSTKLEDSGRNSIPLEESLEQLSIAAGDKGNLHADIVNRMREKSSK